MGRLFAKRSWGRLTEEEELRGGLKGRGEPLHLGAAPGRERQAPSPGFGSGPRERTAE